jgi:hypothetical protein
MKGRWLLLALIAIVLLCAGLAQTSPGHVALKDVGLYEPPASYTELAFSDPGSLPHVLVKPSAKVTVSFSIHNVSDAAHSYQWSITLTRAGTSQVGASGVVQLPAQGRATVSRTVAAACAGGRMQVTAQLVSPAESVSFWLTCPASGKRGGA